MVLLHHIPSFIPKIFDGFIWHKDRSEKKVYLTFDDGPVPGITDFVLHELEARAMKATFFMVGDNVSKNTSLAMEVLKAGHGIGNHTYHHVNGFKTPDDQYFQEVKDCQSLFEDKLEASTDLFRPPYGRITKSQYKALHKDHRIIMWDVLSGDFIPSQSIETCLSKTMKYTRNGSIILFHDQQKTRDVVRQVLPSYLDFLLDSGFETALL